MVGVLWIMVGLAVDHGWFTMDHGWASVHHGWERRHWGCKNRQRQDTLLSIANAPTYYRYVPIFLFIVREWIVYGTHAHRFNWLPFFDFHLDQPPLEPHESGPIGLVLAPARELAYQIHLVCKSLTKPLGLK